MRFIKLSFVIASLLLVTMTQTVHADVTVNLSDAVKNAQKESKDTTSENDLQDNINKGLKEMAKTHKGAKDLFNSGQTIKIICYGEPLAKKLGFKQDADAMMGLFGGFPGETKGDFKKDKTPKSKGTTYIAIDCDKLKSRGWNKPYMDITNDSMWDVLIHELLHATNGDRKHPPDELSVYQEWVKQFIKALKIANKIASNPPLKPTTKPIGTLPSTPSGSTGSNGTLKESTTTPTPQTPEKGKDQYTGKDPKYNNNPGSDGLIFSQPTPNPAMLNNSGIDLSLRSNSLPTLEKSVGVVEQSDPPQLLLREPILQGDHTSAANTEQQGNTVGPIRLNEGTLKSLTADDSTLLFINPTVNQEDTLERRMDGMPIPSHNIVENQQTIGVRQFFSSLHDDQVNTLQGFQAGDPMNMLVEGANGISNSQGIMTLISTDTLETSKITGLFTENVGAGIWGDRRVAQFTLPYDLLPGFYGLNFTVGSQSTKPVLIEIAESPSLNRRRDLVQIIQSAIADKYPYPYTLVGPYSPLPMGTQIKDSISGEVVTTIDQENIWLFFAYDPTAFFGQPDARWIFINGNTEEMQIIENRELWPEVLLSNNQPYPFDYGSHDHLYYGLFNAGPFFQNQDINDDETSKQHDETETPPEGTTSKTSPIIGLTFPPNAGCAPEKIKKYAFILTFDDTDKRFMELINQEKALLKGLGIPSENIHAFDPADFLVADGKTSKFEIDSTGWSKSFSKFRTKLEAVLGKIEDCCAEVLIVVNAHGTKSGNLIFKKAQDVPWKQTLTKKEGVIEIKPSQNIVGKGGPGVVIVNNTPYFKSGLLAKMISDTFKRMKKTCIPVALLIHACYSGKIDGDPKNKQLYEEASTTLENFRVYSSASSNELSYGRIESGNYRFPFLEAIKHCLLESEKKGEKTLEDQWTCIVEKTKALAETFGKKQTPTTYPQK